MSTTTFLFAASLSLAGCKTDQAAQQPPGVLDQVPAEIATVSGRYDTIAACTYGKLDQTGLRKVDLQGEARLMLEGSGVRYWELSFRPSGKNTTVAFSRVQTLWGPMGGQGVMEAVRGCGV
jgi:hypothetical protein